MMWCSHQYQFDNGSCKPGRPFYTDKDTHRLGMRTTPCTSVTMEGIQWKAVTMEGSYYGRQLLWKADAP